MNNPEYKNLLKELRKIGVESVGFLIKVLMEDGKYPKYSTGNLIKSINYDVIKNADDLLLKIMAADYFKYVDEGRRKGAKPPPIKPILSWVRQKGIKFEDNNGKILSSKQTAFIVARGISKNSIKPLNAKKKLFDNIMNKKTQLIANAALKDVSSLLDKIIIDLQK